MAPRGVSIFGTLEAMIETPGLEAIVIASNTVFHVPQSIAAFEQGLHVLYEKPIGFSSATEMENGKAISP
ncbi:hypothetical protein EDB81DRAFT_773576 [Dactylonectria macrodidyma]|uniref:Gfo/Idh/MocA-like oxidoreductase N-terminal domain-containing protein n=1 Tax=Dactylonectria macrodidyma TaxID=307937 RepID=A0A9P9FVG9_9HYPO|nr:hypothetical protein EDB81DRAFT_773576 [Dactylonectria macrodidyma]